MYSKPNVDESRPSDYRQLGEVYTSEWYDDYSDGSLRSARIYVDHLWHLFQPTSVLDVGCGRGSWLAAWHERGVQRVIGLDGNWNGQDKMIDPSIAFEAIDLNQPFTVEGKVDLAMSLEVAEHLLPESASVLVESLARTSDLILFSAAWPHQGGPNHLNEQLPSYWAWLFAERHFVPFDSLRPFFWADERIPFWYRQNSFLYAKRNTDAFQRLAAHGAQPIAHIGFMDCVHPALYLNKLRVLYRLARERSHGA